MDMNRNGTTGWGVVLLAAGLAVSAAWGGASAATRNEQTAACKGDALKLCAFAIPNEARITACMKKKIDRLSPRCRAMFETPAKSGAATKK
ncbi:hypothetical protein GLI01_31710 [Gluconacetobacter liquefaciens]|uniref:Cysteine rich repeat protein n=2 Tax=Gluconacetobacter liquefaciens TaxID=89584 RepID=A0A370FXQ6_GLULI|nr:hypothetical protein C7453_11122 [Gluconacetobacter liquefaciens]GEB39136.1 hypothetical protein GLI01_31710 [Gluconacetobacter liquefaciens]